MNSTFEIYAETCNRLRLMIRKEIKGYSTVSVDAKNDRLEVYIKNGDFEFRYQQKEYLNYVLEHGTDVIYSSIYKAFKGAVNKRFFDYRNENEA